MSLNQIIDQQPNDPLVCDDTLLLKGNRLRLKNGIISPEGDFNNVDTITINGIPYPPGGGFLPTPTPNRILRTNGLSVVSWGDVNPSNMTGGATGDVLKTIAPGVVAWDPVKSEDITPGLANQILHTNALATDAEWTSNLIIPGNCDVDVNLVVAGSSTFQSNVDCDQVLNVDGNTFCNAALTVTGQTTTGDLDVEGDLQFLGVSGTSGQFLKKTGVATQSFQNIVAADMTAGAANSVLTSAGGISQWIVPTASRRIVYGTTFSAQNINQVGPVAANFSTLNFTSIASSTGSPIVGITQPSGTQFMIGTTGTYLANITGYIDPTSTGLGNSIVSLSIEVGGIESQQSCVVCNGNYSFGGSIWFSAVAGQIVRILLRRVVGVGTLNTFADGAGLPNFASTIVFNLLNL